MDSTEALVKAQGLLEYLTRAKSAHDFSDRLETCIQNAGSLHALIDITDSSLKSHEDSAALHFKREAYEEALIPMQLLAALQPNKQSHWLQLGAIRMKLSNFEQALQAFAMATFCEPSDPRPYFFSAFSYCKLNNFKEAELCLNHTIRLSQNIPSNQALEKEAVAFLSYLKERQIA